MSPRCLLPQIIALAACCVALPASAQEHPARRAANVVSVAVEEYAKAVDDNGKLISKDEFDETYGFLTDAKQVAARLGYRLSRVALLAGAIVLAQTGDGREAGLTALVVIISAFTIQLIWSIAHRTRRHHHSADALA